MASRQFNDVAVRVAISLLFSSTVFAQNINGQAAAATSTQAVAATQQKTSVAGTAATSVVVDNGKSTAITGVPTGITAASAAASSAAASGVSTFAGTDLPTLAGASIPTAAVPDTSAAPYMQRSSVPENTIFICVGALLGIMLFGIMLWRAIGFWLIHRSVRRANERLERMGYGDVKNGYLPTSQKSGSTDSKRRTQYTSLAAPSTLSLDHASYATPTSNSHSGNASSKKHASRQPYMSQNSAARNSSLFFSPTAGATPANKSSTHLPSGYYAAPGAAAAGGATSTQIGPGAARQPSGLGRFSTYAGNSPPDSPGLPSSRGGLPGSRGSSSGSRDIPMHFGDAGSRPGSGYGTQSRMSGYPGGHGRMPSTHFDTSMDRGRY